MKAKGLTILEILLALAIMGIAFGALLLSQISNLRASAQSRFATDTKAAAIRVLEHLSNEVASLNQNISSSALSAGDFAFTTYYSTCAASSNNSLCTGTEVSGPITVRWRIFKEPDTLGEGVLNIVVTAEHRRGPKVTLGRRMTCYDVYPSPTLDKPIPCPDPVAANSTIGGTRP